MREQQCRLQLTDALQVELRSKQSVQRFPVCYDSRLFLCDFWKVNLKVLFGRDTFCLYRKQVSLTVVLRHNFRHMHCHHLESKPSGVKACTKR